jgi:aspartate racemase
VHIGLIGGIGPAAQDYYTRQLIALFAQAGSVLDMTIVYADTKMLLENLAADRRAEQADLFAKLTQRLALAGAQCVAVTSIAGHFCRREYEAQSVLPVIDMIGVVAHDVASRGVERIGILGTQTVMRSGLYGGMPTVSVISPPDAEAAKVHAAYVAMASSGKVTTEQQRIFDQAVHRLIETEKVQAILLGGTDLTLAFDAATCPFALIDCAAIHARAIADFAMGRSANS